ncbi:MAG: hypothetical protein ACTSUF_00895 [Candidatus Heimdallarchaeaceae archaeon]
MHDKVDEKGYIEYVDIHPCINDKMSANILYVDKFLTVRSQYVVNVGDDLSAQQIQKMNIPMPKKVEFVNKNIVPLKGVKYRNIKFIRIVDRLRQSNFIFKTKGEGKEYSIISELEFISIEFAIAKNVDAEYAVSWFKMIASILEATALLDDEMLSYLVSYLDTNICKPPTSESPVEVDFILHAKTAIPSSSLKSFAIFRQMFQSLDDSIKHKGFKNYEKVITHCIGNQHKTLLDVYQKLAKSMSFSDFIDYVEDLSMLGALTLRKVELIIIKE